MVKYSERREQSRRKSKFLFKAMPNRILYWAKPNIGKNIVVYMARDIYLLL